MQFTIPVRRLTVVLMIVAISLALISISLKALEWTLGTRSTYFIYQVTLAFNINRESNIPTWFSTLLLATSALLLFGIARSIHKSNGAYRYHWYGLAAIFMFLSIDEAAALHETLTIPVQESLDVSGLLYFGWVIVGFVVALIIGLAYMRFWWRLPPGTRRLFFVAAVLYVGGALIVESISASIWYDNDGTSLAFSAVGTLEECMEMVGIIVLIHALLDYLQTHIGTIELIFPTHQQKEG